MVTSGSASDGEEHHDEDQHGHAEHDEQDQQLGGAETGDGESSHGPDATGAVPSTSRTSRRDVLLLAYDVLEAALTAGSVEDAIEAMRPELEVRSREDLVRVAMALVGEPAYFLLDAHDRWRMLQKLRVRRLEAMVAD